LFLSLQKFYKKDVKSLSNNNIKKGDTVLVLTGGDKDKQSKVLGKDSKTGKVLVEGVNVMKRHTKPRPPKIPHGGILEKAHPVDGSNLMLVCPHCSKPTRVGKITKKEGDKKIKYRVCKKCNELI
jgi:large subunit ribosomal protein L24